jgi:hypothetical protein
MLVWLLSYKDCWSKGLPRSTPVANGDKPKLRFSRILKHAVTTFYGLLPSSSFTFDVHDLLPPCILLQSACSALQWLVIRPPTPPGFILRGGIDELAKRVHTSDAAPRRTWIGDCVALFSFQPRHPPTVSPTKGGPGPLDSVQRRSTIPVRVSRAHLCTSRPIDLVKGPGYS